MILPAARRPPVWLVPAVAAALLLSANVASAQRGPRGGGERGPRSDRGAERGADRQAGTKDNGMDERTDDRKVFDYVWAKVDKNKDGRITRDEMTSDRLKRFMSDRGLDPKKAYSRDEWNRGADAYDEKKYAEAEAKGDEERRARRGGGGGESRDEGRSDRSGGPSYVRGGVKDAKGRPVRITVALPEAFGEFDVDRDGQIGLYEWRQWNRVLLTEFLTLDQDRDGYLTPRELAGADAKLYVRGESAGLSIAPPASSAVASAPPAGAGEQVPAQAPASEMSPSDRATAERSFRLLDRDRSGRISLREWERSVRLKPKFEAAGADLASELDLEAFVTTYAKTLDD